MYDKTRRTVTGKGKDERELWQVEDTLPEETVVWMPQRPESEAEPEQRGGVQAILHLRMITVMVMQAKMG